MEQTLEQLYADLETQIDTLGRLLDLEQRIGAAAEETNLARLAVEDTLRLIRAANTAA